MNKRGIAFVIMQIGNSELDKLYEEVYVKAIEDANLSPKRIDLDNQGELLKKEIIEYIEKADIIIADLTNERPNCYLEIGYAMGLDKYKNLIFTVREDHFPESPNYKKGGPKIHFDVTGYDILFWENSKWNEFKIKLTERINRRLAIIGNTPLQKVQLIWDETWLNQQKSHVQLRLKELGFNRYVEIKISPTTPLLNLSQSDILDIANESQIETFGWPIAVVFKDLPEYKPLPKKDGIISEVVGNINGASYDFTYFRKNGQIFITKNLFEEHNFNDSIIPEARIKRTTELLLYISRFYSRCNMPKNDLGMANNKLHFIGGIPIRMRGPCKENESFSEMHTSISEIENNLPELVNELLSSLFVLFDFYNPGIGFVKSVVDQFVSETKRTLR
jgi:hypothetical protein